METVGKEQNSPAPVHQRKWIETALRAGAAVAATGIAISTLFPWFGITLSRLPSDMGFLVVTPAAPWLNPWEASIPWAILIVVLSVAAGLEAIAPLGSAHERTQKRGAALALIGACQAIATTLFARFGAPQPVPKQIVDVYGHDVTVGFAISGAGRLAFFLCLVVAACGASLMSRSRRELNLARGLSASSFSPRQARLTYWALGAIVAAWIIAGTPSSEVGLMAAVATWMLIFIPAAAYLGVTMRTNRNAGWVALACGLVGLLMLLSFWGELGSSSRASAFTCVGIALLVFSAVRLDRPDDPLEHLKEAPNQPNT